MTNKDLKKKIIKATKDNHMWINAFSLINPTDAIKIKIGEWVINNLSTKESLLPTLFDGDNNEVVDIQKITSVFYCSINAS